MVPHAQGLLLSTESSMRSEGVLKAAVHGTEAAQRFREGTRTRKLIITLERSMACTQAITDTRITQSGMNHTTAALDK